MKNEKAASQTKQQEGELGSQVAELTNKLKAAEEEKNQYEM